MSHASAPVTGRATSRDGTTIGYEAVGTGPPIVLVDPASGFREYGPMRELAAQLAGDFTVVAYDRRGRGESTDTEPYAVAREVDDLAALIDSVGGRASVHGYSSGAALALHAAAAGLPIDRLTLLEPAVELDGPAPDDADLGAEIRTLVAQGRRGDAVEHFHRSIGVPDEYLVGMREQAVWPQLEALAHTLAYDAEVTDSMTAAIVSRSAMPALVINSQATDDQLLAWGRELASRLPNGRHTVLPGEWHGVAADVLAPAIRDFLLERDAS